MWVVRIAFLIYWDNQAKHGMARIGFNVLFFFDVWRLNHLFAFFSSLCLHALLFRDLRVRYTRHLVCSEPFFVCFVFKPSISVLWHSNSLVADTILSIVFVVSDLYLWASERLKREKEAYLVIGVRCPQKAFPYWWLTRKKKSSRRGLRSHRRAPPLLICLVLWLLLPKTHIYPSVNNNLFCLKGRGGTSEHLKCI